MAGYPYDNAPNSNKLTDNASSSSHAKLREKSELHHALGDGLTHQGEQLHLVIAAKSPEML